jgi:predicted  nucleic acid-binding Zn-ribbon protein
LEHTIRVETKERLEEQQKSRDLVEQAESTLREEREERSRVQEHFSETETQIQQAQQTIQDLQKKLQLYVVILSATFSFFVLESQ